MAKVYEAIAAALTARANCITQGNVEWQANHEHRLAWLADNRLPHGSGFDNGTYLDIAASRQDRIVLRTSFHHMDDGGMYSGWTEHNVFITPSFIGGFDLRITGRNRNDIKDYIAATLHTMLTEDAG